MNIPFITPPPVNKTGFQSPLQNGSKTFLGELLGTAKDAALEKGKSIIKDVITNPTSVSLLPKTKTSKEAEQVIRTVYAQNPYQNIAASNTALSFGNPVIIVGIVLLVLLIAFIIKSKG